MGPISSCKNKLNSEIIYNFHCFPNAHLFLLLVMWGSQKKKKKNSNLKTQVTKEKSMWASKNRTNKKFKTKDIAFKEE